MIDSPSRTLGVREFTGAAIDVTERRLAEEVNARMRNAALRVDVSCALARAGSLRAILQGCAEALVRHLDVAFARIWTLPRGGKVLMLDASAGRYTNVGGAHGRIPVGELKIGLIAHERRPHLTNDVPNDPRVTDKAWAAREGMIAFAGYPLVADDRVVGVMAMFARRPLAPDDLETLASIADAIAQGIERKRSEDALRRSEAYLVEGQRLSQTGSWAWNVRTGERFWSREVFRIHGFEPADVPPPVDTVRAMTPPADLDAWDEAFRSAVRDGAAFEIGCRIRLVEGSTRHLHIVGHPVLDETGAVEELIGTIVDVTDRRRAERRLRRATRARFEAVLAERLRFARDMHDGLLQDVAGISLQLQALLPHVTANRDDAAARLQRILELVDRTSREARAAVVGMRSTGSAPVDLTGAIDRAAREAVCQSHVTLSLTVAGRARHVRRRVHDAVVGVVREAVTNVVRHADARTITVVLTFCPKGCRVSIRDDGNGFEPGSVGSADGHFGLVGMRERGSQAGGSLELESAPGSGTVVTLRVPYRHSAGHKAND